MHHRLHSSLPANWRAEREIARQIMVKLRHAAALALVGWYLMTPPLGTRLGATTPFWVDIC